MQKTPVANRIHIGIYGHRNVGKSTLINALTNQPIALVSDVPGTTSDPVYKKMELHGLGPVVFIDTAGIDDTGELGEQRVKISFRVLEKSDLIILIVEPKKSLSAREKLILNRVREKEIPLLIVVNKIDLYSNSELKNSLRKLRKQVNKYGIKYVLPVSAKQKKGLAKLRKDIIKKAPVAEKRRIVGDLLKPGDCVVLVVPIDVEAPEGRLILPQVQTLRDILDADGYAVMVKEGQLEKSLNQLEEKPELVICDSQVFATVGRVVPEEIKITSFSILFSRYKGNLATFVRGTRYLEQLQPGDRVLISEACTHHPIEKDIGREKIPHWLEDMVQGQLEFAWTAGSDFEKDLENFKLVIHCGGCMINRREMLYRLEKAKKAGVPITNYGMVIAYVHGLLDRTLQPFQPLAESY